LLHIVFIPLVRQSRYVCFFPSDSLLPDCLGYRFLTLLSPQKGELDLTGAARIVLRDWSSGKFSHYTTPPLPKSTSIAPVSAASESTSANPVNAALEQLCEKDVSILGDLPTRRERRKGGGLVRLTAGIADQRRISVGEVWAALQDSEEEESEEGDDIEDVYEGMSVDEGDLDEDEDNEDNEEQPDSDEEEEEEAQPLLPSKQKRKRTLDKSVRERPPKKVAFAPQPPPKKSRSGTGRSGDVLVRFSLTLTTEHTFMITLVQQVKLSPRPAVKRLEKSKSTVPVTNPAKSRFSVTSSAGGALTKPSSENNRKVANMMTKMKAKAASGDEKPRNGPEVYDFGKFF